MRVRRQLAMAAMASLACGTAARAADDALIAAARKEGQVVWYTSFVVDQMVRPMIEGFEKSYGIKVAYVRANTSEIVLRIVNESKAGRVQADVFDSTTAAPPLKKAGVVAKFVPESAKHFPKEMVDPEGYWVATNIYVLAPAANTEQVPPQLRPRTWEDFLDPRWKGKIAWSTSASSGGAPGFIGTVLKEWGPERGQAYLEKLARQQIAGIDAAARQVTDQVIAGEYALALQIFNNQPVTSARAGAPVDWLPVQPVTASPSTASVLKDAPHPNAARLFVDYFVSAAGQKIVAAGDYIPADPDVPARTPELKPDGVKLRAQSISPEELDASMPGWVALYQRLFR